MRYRVRITQARSCLVIVKNINKIVIRIQSPETKIVWV
jgi:hypothetical protein